MTCGNSEFRPTSVAPSGEAACWLEGDDEIFTAPESARDDHAAPVIPGADSGQGATLAAGTKDHPNSDLERGTEALSVSTGREPHPGVGWSTLKSPRPGHVPTAPVPLPGDAMQLTTGEPAAAPVAHAPQAQLERALREALRVEPETVGVTGVDQWYVSDLAVDCDTEPLLRVLARGLLAAGWRPPLPDSETEWGHREPNGEYRAHRSEFVARLWRHPARREVGPWIEVPHA